MIRVQVLLTFATATSLSVALPTDGREGNKTCRNIEAIEWRVRGLPAKDVENAPRAAVCFVGVFRFLDQTAESLEERLLKRLNSPFDIFAFASTGRKPQKAPSITPRKPPEAKEESVETCEEFHDLAVRPGPSGKRPWSKGAGPRGVPREEWGALQRFLDRAAAGRVVWDDRPLRLLQGSGAWRSAVLRPGFWLGGVERAGQTRPGAGVAQLRQLQWCADAVRWQEEQVRGGRRYTEVVVARWDSRWLLPFPGLPLLRRVHGDAVWLPSAHGAPFLNDRFAVVPRRHLSAYFEGWKLLVGGLADKVFEAALPRVGVPVYDGEPANPEMFLLARLKYGKVATAGLPPMFYIQCWPSSDFSNLRTGGAFMCTDFSVLFGSGVLTELFGGTKYPREVRSILDADEFIAHHTLGAQHTLSSQFKRFAEGFEVPWTQDLLLATAQQAADVENGYMLHRAACVRTDEVRPRSSTSPGSHGCFCLLRRLMALHASWRALELARAMVIVAPLHALHWIWLTALLAHPPISKTEAACASLKQLFNLNPTHWAANRLALEGGLEPSSSQEHLAAALGSANASARFRLRSLQTRRVIRRRRVLQERCAQYEPETKKGLDSWLAFGEFLLRRRWVSAAVGVLGQLELPWLADGRPEFQRLHASEVGRVRSFQTRVAKEAESPADLGLWGATMELHQARAPSRAELLSASWLESLEALTSEGGRDVGADSVTGFVFSWSSLHNARVLVDVTR